MNAQVLHIDFETRSAIDLTKVGVYKYAEHPSTDVWCAAYAFGDGPVQLWKMGEPCPPVIRAHVESGGMIAAWNANFERILWKNVLSKRYDWPEPKLEQYYCVMVMAYAMAIPGQLAMAAPALGLNIEKDMAGNRLMLQMCRPRKVSEGWTGKKCPTCKGWGVVTRSDGEEQSCRKCIGTGDEWGTIYQWWDEPEKRERLYAYCKTDVDVERLAETRLVRLRPQERELWLLDQRINDRGVYIDLKLCHQALKIVAATSVKLDAAMRKVTEGEVTGIGQVQRLMIWMRTRGVNTESVNKETLTNLLAKDNLPADVRTALELRQEGAKTSTAKIKSLIERTCADGRMRGNLQFHGATTGRWSARGAQLQNLPRPNLKNIQLAIEAIMTGDADYVEMLFDKPLSVVSDCIRSMIVAPQGYDVLAADLANIEGRVLPWLAGQVDKLDAFREYDAGTGPDLYLVAAAGIYNVMVTSLNSKSPERQIGKVAELACLAGGTRILTSNGVKPLLDVSINDKVWDGNSWVTHSGVIPRGYRKTMLISGVELTPDHKILSGRRWLSAAAVGSCPSTLHSTKVTGLESLRLCALSTGPWAASRRSMSVALAERPHTLWTRTICGKGRPAAARLVDASRPRRLSRGGINTRVLYPTWVIGAGFAIASLRRTTGATAPMTRGFRTTAAGVSPFTRLGGKTEACFWRTSSRLRAGITRFSRWIGSTSTEGTNPVTSASSRSERISSTNGASSPCRSGYSSLRPVYDIANAGPNNRFTVLSDDGALIVHNCGFGGSTGAFQSMAKKFDLRLPNAQVKEIVTAWRQKYSKIVAFWGALQTAAIKAIANPGTTTTVGLISYRVSGTFLWCRLPSGRAICYPYPKLVPTVWVQYVSDGRKGTLPVAEAKDLLVLGKITIEGSEFDTIGFRGMDAYTHKWSEQRTYGGSLCENVTQAVARDIMSEGMLRADAAGIYGLTMTVHDEIISDVANGTGSVEDFIELMTRLPAWAEGLPVAAEGFRDKRYRK